MGNFVYVQPISAISPYHWSGKSFSSLNAITPGLTSYAPLEGLEQLQGVEAVAQQLITRDGYVDNLRVWLDGVPLIDLAVVLRVGGVDTVLLVTVPGAGTTGQNVADQITVAAGNLLSYRIPTNAMHNAVTPKIAVDYYAEI